MASILVVTWECPFPAQGNGYTLRFNPILTYLGRRHDLDMLVCGNQQPEVLEQAAEICRTVVVQPKPELKPFRRRLRTVAASLQPYRAPWEVISPWSTEFASRAAELLREKPYDSFLIAGGSDLASVLAHGRLGPTRAVFDWIDSPSLHLERRAVKQTGLNRRIMDRRVERFKRFQVKLNQRFDATIYIADPDRRHANGDGETTFLYFPTGCSNRPPLDRILVREAAARW